MSYTKYDLEQLTEIKEQIKDLAFDALEILASDSIEYQRAYAYWYPHILMAVDNEHDFLGNSICTIDDSINEIAAVIEKERIK
jgi:hypothetical protein